MGSKEFRETGGHKNREAQAIMVTKAAKNVHPRDGGNQPPVLPSRMPRPSPKISICRVVYSANEKQELCVDENLASIVYLTCYFSQQEGEGSQMNYPEAGRCLQMDG